MRTCNYSDVLVATAALAGITAGDIAADATAQALINTFHTRRLKMAWEIHAWPDVCRTEQRYFRQIYSATATYGTAGLTTTDEDNSANEVFDFPTMQYYQSLVANNLGNPPSVNGCANSAFWAVCQPFYEADCWGPAIGYNQGDQAVDALNGQVYQSLVAQAGGAAPSLNPATWGLLTPFQRYVAYSQPGLTAFNDVLGAWDRDPRLFTKVTKLPFTMTELGAEFTELKAYLISLSGLPAGGGNYFAVWLKYRIQTPLLSGAAWSSTAVYTSGQSVYYVNLAGAGNFYTAATATTAGQSPDTTPAAWTVIPVPYIFRDYLVLGGYADWLTSDGQGDKAAALEGNAEQMLELEADKLQRQGQQVNRFEMVR